MGGWGVSRARRVRCGVSAVHPLLQHVADTFQRRYASLSQFQLTQGARRPRLARADGEPSRVDRTDGASRRGRCIHLLVVRTAPLQRTLDVRQPAEPTPRRGCRTLYN